MPPLRILFLMISVYVCVMYTACDVARDNPLDPGSSGYIGEFQIKDPNPSVFKDYRINTLHIEHDRPEENDYYYYIARAIIEDVDGIDSVYLEVSDGSQASLADTLVYVMEVNDSTGYYEYRSKDLWLNIYDYTDADFYVRVIDGKSCVTYSEKEKLGSILTELPVKLQPLPNDSTDTTPIFKWERLVAPYKFTYSIMVFKYYPDGMKFSMDSIPNTSWPDSVISVDFSDVEFELLRDEYFWILGIKDADNNMSFTRDTMFKALADDEIDE